MRKLTCLAAALLAACGSTTKDVRSGRAWDDAKPSDYRATRDEIADAVVKFVTDRDFTYTVNEDRSFIKAYRKGTGPTEQNQNIQVRVEPGSAAGMTRVTAVAGRSLGIVSDRRSMVTRLHNYLRSTYGNR